MHARRAEPEGRDSPAASSTSRWRRRRSRRRWRSSRPTPSSRATPPMARATTPRRPGSRSSTTAAIPPNTTDYTPIVRAMQATNPDLVCVCSYPPDTVGIIRAVNEIGLQAQDDRRRHGRRCRRPRSRRSSGRCSTASSIIDFWVPAPTMQFPGVMDFIKTLPGNAPRKRASTCSATTCRPGPIADLQVLAQAIEGDEEHRRRQARRLPARQHLQDGRRRHRVRRQGRARGRTHHPDPVPGHQGQRPRPVPQHRDPGDRRCRRAQVRQRDLSLREGAGVAAALPLPACGRGSG